MVDTAFMNGRFGPLKNHANNAYVAVSNLAKGAIFSISWLYAQHGLIEASLTIGKAAPAVAGTLFYAGNMSWVWLTPLALAILVSLRGLGNLLGEPEFYDKCAWFEDRIIRFLPGSDLLIQGMLFATKPIAQVAITVSACAVAYFVGGYATMALAAYTIFDTLSKVQLLSQPLQHLDARITQGLYGVVIASSGSLLDLTYGVKLVYNAITNSDIKPLTGFDKFISFKKIDLTKTHNLTPHPQAALIEDLTCVEVDTTHMRPATLPKSIGNMKLDEINFRDQIDDLWAMMEEHLEEPIVAREIANERGIYDRWRGGREDTFTLQKEFLRKGHAMCIESCAKQRRAGDSRQEDLAKAAAAAVTVQKGKEGKLAKHSFLVTLGIVGHFCPTRKGEGIDSLVAGYLSESADALPTKIEGVLRDKRSELFQEHFIGTLLQNHPNEFGPGRACDLRNVHYKYALVYVAGLDLGLHEHWGAHNEANEFGSDTIRAVKAIYERTGCANAARAAFDTAYSKDLILETIQESIASENNGTLKLTEVEAWFTDWLLKRDIVQLEDSDTAQIERIQRAITEKASEVEIEQDETQGVHEQKASALADLIQPRKGALDRRFVEALALEHYQNAGNVDYMRAYLSAKARAKFEDEGCNYLDEALTKLAPEKTWIATMLAEMGFVKKA